MGGTIPRALLLAALAMLLALPLAAPARAAAPRFLLVYGTALARPVVLADWQENLDFMLATTEPAAVTSEELARRPYLDLALFWGQPWNDYATRGSRSSRCGPSRPTSTGASTPPSGPRSR